MKQHAMLTNNQRFIRTALLSFIFSQLSSSKNIVYGEQWALHVESGEAAANQLASRHNLVNLGEVLPESNIYHFSFKHEQRGKRSAEDISSIHELLKEAPETRWIEHQAILTRSKRVPMEREKRQTGRDLGRTCVISTVQTDKKESRRCVFPFEYKGKVYLQCTSDHSGNKKEWCGTEVKSNGEVVDGQWGDCDKDSVVCYTTKVVVEKESFGSVQQTPGRVQSPPSSINTQVRQRLPVNAPRQRPSSPIPSQNRVQRPVSPPQSVRLPPQQSSRLTPQQLSRLVPQQSSRGPPPQSPRLTPEQIARIISQQSSRQPPQQSSRLPPQQSSRIPPQLLRDGIQSQRLPPGFPPRQQPPQRTNNQGVPRQFLGRPPPRPNVQQQQGFEPQVLPPLTEPVNPQRLSQEQIFAILNNVRGPPKESNVAPANTPKLEELKTKWNDPLWPQMWFLNRGDDELGNGLDMNVEEAWKTGVSGKGVVVTILDDGVEWSHPDLEENYDAAASRDLNDRDADPFPRYDILNSNKHGTRCAGQVSAAANNSKCGVGIAYNSKIGGVRVLDGAIVDALEAEAMSFNRNHIDIYSASWGPDDDGRTVDGPGPLASRALEEGILKGRNGLGSIFVWASGNGGKFFDNCNTDGYTTSIYTLSISSVSEGGLIPWYSEPCSSSIATTYSSGATRSGERKVVTTDLRGKCTTKHTGTSASSPIASGIVALALEANKNMTWRDVQHLVIRSARPRGNLKAKDWRINGVGLHFSHSYGFGLIDAAHLVEGAKNWKTVPEQSKCVYKQPLTDKKLQYLILPGREESFSLDVENTGCMENIKFLEHFHIVINLSSGARRGDLSVSVTSPMGTTSELLGRRPFDDIRTGFSLFGKWPMMSVHFWGENPVGKWTLVVKNQGDTGRATLHDWHVVFYGTKVDPQPGSPIKPNYKGSNGNARKVELRKNSEKVKFTNLSKQQTRNNLAKICPGCFKKAIVVKAAKPSKTNTTVLTDPEKTPNKNAAFANIAQVCPHCFKKQTTAAKAKTEGSSSGNGQPITSKSVSESLVEEIDISRDLEEKETSFLNTFDVSVETSTLSLELDTEENISLNATNNVTNQDTTNDKPNANDEPIEYFPTLEALVAAQEAIDQIEDEDAVNESTEITDAINNEKKDLIEVESTLSVEENEPRSLINKASTDGSNA